MRGGVRVGVDVGTVRVGIAHSDPHGMLATPFETVARARNGSDVRRITAIVTELEAVEVIVGLPLSLSGARTRSTEDATDFALAIAQALAVDVRMVDERLSTVTAQSGLHASGKNTKKSRIVIDQAAATVILQQALDLERARDTPPGTLIDPNRGSAQ